MKKTIAGILALLCVLSPLNGSWLPSGGGNSSIVMEAYAASTQKTKNSHTVYTKYKLIHSMRKNPL